MRSAKTLIPLLLAVAALPLFAQQDRQNDGTRDNGGQGTEQNQPDPSPNASEEEGPRRFWQVSLPGGHYMVALDHIASVSMHEYLLDGSLVINEVTVDAGGRGLARFYHISTNPGGSAQPAVARTIERGKEFIDRAARRGGIETHNMVQKSYPTTTHTGMVEYRVLDLRDLDALYNSVQKAWENNRGSRLTIR